MRFGGVVITRDNWWRDSQLDQRRIDDEFWEGHVLQSYSADGNDPTDHSTYSWSLKVCGSKGTSKTANSNECRGRIRDCSEGGVVMGLLSGMGRSIWLKETRVVTLTGHESGDR